MLCSGAYACTSSVPDAALISRQQTAMYLPHYTGLLLQLLSLSVHWQVSKPAEVAHAEKGDTAGNTHMRDEDITMTIQAFQVRASCVTAGHALSRQGSYKARPVAVPSVSGAKMPLLGCMSVHSQPSPWQVQHNHCC
jgi:hypothetical protein